MSEKCQTQTSTVATATSVHSPDLNPIDRSSPSSSTYCARPPRARPKPSTSQSAKSSEHLRPPNAPLAMPNPKKHHALVFVRLAHDRRFVGGVLFLFVLVLFVFIRISGRHRVAHDHEGTPVDQPGGKFLGDVWCHVVAPWVWTLGDFDIVSSTSYVRKVPQADMHLLSC